jgi:hypothetical protein
MYRTKIGYHLIFKKPRKYAKKNRSEGILTGWRILSSALYACVLCSSLEDPRRGLKDKIFGSETEPRDDLVLHL